jgi:hypothetical protein
VLHTRLTVDLPRLTGERAPLHHIQHNKDISKRRTTHEHLPRGTAQKMGKRQIAFW